MSLQLPRQIPIIVLPNTVLFPHSLLPLHIFEERYREMLRAALDTTRIFGVAPSLQVLRPDLPVPDLCEIIGVGVVRACVERADGTSDLILQGLARIRIVGETQRWPFRIVEGELLDTVSESEQKVALLCSKIKEQAQVLSSHGYQMPQQMEKYLESIEDPEVIGDLMAAAFVGTPAIRQDILAAEVLTERLKLILSEMEQLATR